MKIFFKPTVITYVLLYLCNFSNNYIIIHIFYFECGVVVVKILKFAKLHCLILKLFGKRVLNSSYGQSQKCDCRHSPVQGGVIQQDGCQVQSVNGSVIRRAHASQSQTGCEQVHHICQLEAHLSPMK